LNNQNKHQFQASELIPTGFDSCPTKLLRDYYIVKKARAEVVAMQEALEKTRGNLRKRKRSTTLRWRNIGNSPKKKKLLQ
jgi:hypothetical protein